MSVAAEEGASSDDVDRRRRKPQLVCAMSGSARQIGLEPRILVARADANFVPILYPSELTHADLSAPGTAQMSQSGPTSPRSAGLITQRSQVQILPPLLRKALETGPFSLSVGSRKTLPAGQEQRPRAQKGVVVLGVDDDSSRQRGGCQFARRRRIHGSDCCTARAEARFEIWFGRRSAGECSSDCSAVCLNGGRWRRVARLAAGGRPARVRAGVAPHCAAGEPPGGQWPVG
jgi:hypothetical protein